MCAIYQNAYLSYMYSENLINDSSFFIIIYKKWSGWVKYKGIFSIIKSSRLVALGFNAQIFAKLDLYMRHRDRV